MEVLIHTFIQTKATWGKRTCPRFETASVGLNPGPLDLETCALPTRPPRPTKVEARWPCGKVDLIRTIGINPFRQVGVSSVMRPHVVLIISSL